MPARPEGVYADRRGQWYFKVSLGKDGLTGRRSRSRVADTRRRVRLPRLDGAHRQARRGTCEAGRGRAHRERVLDLYLDGWMPTSACRRRPDTTTGVYAQTYVRKPLGNRSVRDVTPELILTWQRRLLAEGGAKDAGLWRRTRSAWRARRLQEPSGSRFRAGSWLSIRSCTRQDRRPGVRSRAIGAPSRPASSSP